jgi:hypothetical protein
MSDRARSGNTYTTVTRLAYNELEGRLSDFWSKP